ncbi:glycosyltransferase family 2 protein [Puniceicoccus vermicola]|uniref:Glycosyltransferase n=1 Tax=Puniceicoccus vermicola TaxID=388746 RepID=A0A7X1E531_9BACT|nr:glycosyltransferase family 2 protein [Puniceicoccus vermicola]MBC2601192.1 glycosyltransferase [Puniceicoccus vermicola]
MISVVTIVYNSPEDLRCTIDSVSSQEFEDFEFIVIDGGSDVETINVINDNFGIIDILVSEPDRGISDAFNKGVSLAGREYVIFLNAGDRFLESTTLKDASNKIKECVSGGDIIYGDSIGVGSGYAIMRCGDHQRLKQHNSICHQAVFIRRQFLLRKSFDLDLKLKMDYDLWLRSLESGNFVKIDVVVCLYSLSGISAMRENRFKGRVLEILLRDEHHLLGGCGCFNIMILFMNSLLSRCEWMEIVVQKVKKKIGLYPYHSENICLYDEIFGRKVGRK